MIRRCNDKGDKSLEGRLKTCEEHIEIQDEGMNQLSSHMVRFKERLDKLEQEVGERDEEDGPKMGWFDLHDRIKLLEEDMDNNDVGILDIEKRLNKLENEVGQQEQESLLNIKARLEELEKGEPLKMVEETFNLMGPEGMSAAGSSAQVREGMVSITLREPYLTLSEEQCSILKNLFVQDHIGETIRNTSPKEFLTLVAFHHGKID